MLFKYKFDYWEMLSQESIHILPEEGMILHSDTHADTHKHTVCVHVCMCMCEWMDARIHIQHKQYAFLHMLTVQKALMK